MRWIKLLFCLCFSLIQDSHQISTESLLDSNSFGVPTLLLDYLQLTLSSKLLVDIFSPTAQTLKGYLGWLPKKSNLTYTSCSGEDSISGTICLRYGKNMKLVVMQDNSDHCETESETCHVVPCHKIHWTSHIGGAMDCFLLGEDSWYGGGEMLGQRWPMQSDSIPWYPTVTGDPLQHVSGNVIENLWISSSGFAIHVDHSTPLFVSFNESGSGKICFTTSSKKHPYQNEIPEMQHLTYSICSASSVKEAFAFSLHRWIQKPYETPDEMLFHYPIWSTWARYKKNIDENTVLQFAAEIIDSGLSASQIEIDDKWEDCYGNLKFDSFKFPTPDTMTSKLRSLNLPATLWVHLFCNKECEAYDFGKKNGYWVKDAEGNISEVKWWNGVGAALDVTNEKAVKWFVERLQKLQVKYGVESFKFDGGELLWFDRDFVFHNPEVNVQPNVYSQMYAEIAAQFGNRVEVRIGYNSQHLPVITRMFDKYSTWDHTNGLKSLIPNALHLSLLGYYFILPDMVGGNNYNSLNNSLPDRELYIRWLEVNVFLPFLQFSITPWDYDDGVVSIVKKMMLIREEYSSYILKIAQQSTISGDPIIRPLWWIAPDDIEALTIDTEFLVGDGILVAPVVEKGVRHRDIYLPDGRWADVQKGKVYTGSQWLYDYEAPLNFLPFFIGHS